VKYKIGKKKKTYTKYMFIYGIISFVELTVALIKFSWYPRCLKCGCAGDRLMVLRVGIPPTALRYLSCECCMLSGRSLCVGLVTRPEGSYRLWCVWVQSWSLENDEALAPTRGLCANQKEINFSCKIGIGLCHVNGIIPPVVKQIIHSPLLVKWILIIGNNNNNN